MSTVFWPSRSSVSRFVVICWFAWLPVLTYAQNHARLNSREVARKGKYYSRHSANVNVQKPHWLQPGFSFTALSLQIDRTQHFAGAYIVAGADTFLLQQDEHQTDKDTLRQSSLVVLRNAATRVLFVPSGIRGTVQFSFFNADPPSRQRHSDSAHTYQLETAEDPCGKPAVVAQSTWRAGLPAPVYQRRPTEVSHVIVHHAATYNHLTDYENVVRNIYLFHTQDRGWSDIGYNYLVAQDGTVFEGRSPGTQPVATDNIQGAHFCGNNSGTMGICLLGNYETAVPTTAALASLRQLIAWKVRKEGLDPLSESYHPANARLGTIAGHRNGCSTACPGEHLYAVLGEIRRTVAEEAAQGCEPLAFNVYADPATRRIYLRMPNGATNSQIRICNLQGQSVALPFVFERAGNRWVADFTALAAGVYIVQLQGTRYAASQKVLLLHGG